MIAIGTNKVGLKADALTNELDTCTLNTSGITDIIECDMSSNSNSDFVLIKIPSSLLGVQYLEMDINVKKYVPFPSPSYLIYDTLTIYLQSATKDWLYYDLSGFEWGNDRIQIVFSKSHGVDMTSSDLSVINAHISLSTVPELETLFDVLDANTSKAYQEGYEEGYEEGEKNGYDNGVGETQEGIALDIFNNGIEGHGYDKELSSDYLTGKNSVITDINFDDILDWVFKPFEILEIKVFGNITFGHFAFVSIMFGLMTFLFRFRGGK
jgi:hypothetical protein